MCFSAISPAFSKSTSTITRSEGARVMLLTNVSVPKCPPAPADELHFRIVQCELERARICRIGKKEADHIAVLGLRKLRIDLTIDEHRIAEAPHEGMISFFFAVRERSAIPS